MWQLFNNFNKICDILSFLKIKTRYSESFFSCYKWKKKRKKKEIVRARLRTLSSYFRYDEYCPIYTPSDAESKAPDTQIG